MTMSYTKVEDWLTALFNGEFRKSGEPSAKHPIRVGRMARVFCLEPDTVMAAYLHDVLEDFPAITKQFLLDMGFNQRTIAIVEQLTKPKGMKYEDYISRLLDSGNFEAIQVKLLDNFDNTDLARSGNLPIKDIMYFANRYEGVRDALIVEALNVH